MSRKKKKPYKIIQVMAKTLCFFGIMIIPYEAKEDGMERKSDAVSQEILNRIHENFWKPGDRIVSERDLAQLFGVSRVTIRRAIAHLVNQGYLATKPRRYGTFVTDKASQERKSASPFICVAIDNRTPAFASLLLEGIHDSLAPKGFQTIYSNTDFGGIQARDQLESILKTGIAGLVFAPLLGKGSDAYNQHTLSQARAYGIPLIQVDREFRNQDYDWVGCNNHDAMHQLTLSLLSEGKRDIQIVSGFKTTSTEERIRGILSAVESHPEAQLHVLHLDEEAFLHSGEVIITKGTIASHPDVIIGLNQTVCHAATQIPALDKDIPTATIVSCVQECDSDYAMIQPLYEIGHTAGTLMARRISQPDSPAMHIHIQARMWKRLAGPTLISSSDTSLNPARPLR